MNLCRCGCGRITPTRFHRGHNGKLGRRLKRAVRTGELVTIYGQTQSPHVVAQRVSPAFAAHLLRTTYKINEAAK